MGALYGFGGTVAQQMGGLRSQFEVDHMRAREQMRLAEAGIQRMLGMPASRPFEVTTTFIQELRTDVDKWLSMAEKT